MADERLERLYGRIIKHEGFRSRPYRCTSGRLTIGYGRNLEDRGITRNEAIVLLEHDLFDATAGAQRLVGAQVWASLPRDARDVLTEMVYQMGEAGVGGFRRMLAALACRAYQVAAEEMLDSRWAQQTPARAKELAALMRGCAG